MSDISYDERRRLVQTEGVTLDGRPAKIVGVQLDFAQVCTRGTADPVYVEFAWPTVARVVAAGGEFRS